MKNDILLALTLVALFNLSACTQETPSTVEAPTSDAAQESTTEPATTSQPIPADATAAQAADGTAAQAADGTVSQTVGLNNEAVAAEGQKQRALENAARQKAAETAEAQKQKAAASEVSPADQEKFQKRLWTKQQERFRLYKQDLDDNSKAGMAALKAGKLDEAEKMFLVALAQVDSYQGQDLREAAILNNLASVYEQKEMYYQSLPLYSRAQKLFIRAQGRKYPAVAMTLSNMGRVLSKQSRWPEAASIYRTAVELTELRGDNKSEEYIDTLKSYITALRMAGEGLRLQETEAKLKKLEPVKS